jgi:soluble lytic murein transglycosylase-like protein
MILRRTRLPFSAVLLCGTVGFSVYSSAAMADVFEIRGDGEWQQVDKLPANAVEFDFDSLKNDGEKLPPIRLVAIGGAVQAASPVQSLRLSSAPARGQYAPVINAAAEQYGISPALVDAVMWQESRYNPRAMSSAGAIGLMQLMPGTATTLGVDPYDPWQNVFGGAAYLRMQLDRFGNNVPLALAAYNAGPEAVVRYRGIPPYAETRNYVNNIMRRLSQ